MGKRSSMGNDPIESVDESKRDKVQWTEKMDECLIDALLHQQTIGNRVDGNWTSIALSNVSKELTEKLEMDINKDRVKNRLKTMKQKFSSCFDLFKNLSGFAWCPITSMWTAEREAWEPLLKANHDASKYMNNPVHNYEKMLQLFGKDRATGEGAITAKEKRRRLENATNMGEDDTIINIDMLASRGEITIEGFPRPNDDLERIIPPVKEHATETSSKRKKKKDKEAPLAKEEDKEVLLMKEAVEHVAEAIREGNAMYAQSQSLAFTNEDIHAELVTIGVEKDLRSKAYLYLVKNSDMKGAFFGVPCEERKDLVLAMLEA